MICLVGNIVQLFGASISVFDKINILSSAEILVGFGCMLAYLNIGRYIEYAENYSTIFVTIKNALPKVARYLIGVTPIFLGFLFFGLCIFWRSERFTNTSNVLIILFSLAQGDSVFDVFKDLSGLYFFIGQIYLYFFLIIFIVVVLNIFIAIIEEAYVTSKMENKTHWVFDYIKNTQPNQNNETNTFKPQIIPVKNKKINKLNSTENLLKYSFNTEKDNFEIPECRSTIESEVDQLKRKMEEEFNYIDEDLKLILQLSLEVKIYGDDNLIDELRVNILDRINVGIFSKTQAIRLKVSEWNKN